MVTEAQIYLEREQQGFKEESLQDKAHIDPETQKVYEQMYSLGPQAYPEGAVCDGRVLGYGKACDSGDLIFGHEPPWTQQNA